MQEDDKTLVGGLTLNLTFSLKSQNGGVHPIIGETYIGRGEDNQIVINDKKVSRKHALIEVVNGKLLIQDLKSSNGTLVNGKKITSIHPIVNGDTISFDSNIFTVEVSIKSDESEDENTLSATVELKKPEPIEAVTQSVEQQAEKVEPVKVVEPVQQETTPEPKQEVKTAEKIVSKTSGDKKLPASWIEENNVNDGTRMMDIKSLNALRESSNATIKSAQVPKDVDVTTLHCNIDGVSQLFELVINPGEQQSSWELGRSPDCDIVLDHPSVSSRHAQIIHTSGRWKIVNLVSTNGILVNGQKKLTAFLSDGDKVGLGSTQIIFKTPRNQKSYKKKASTGSSPAKILIPVALIALLGIIGYLAYDYFK